MNNKEKETSKLKQVCNIVNPDCVVKSCCTTICGTVINYVCEKLSRKEFNEVYDEIIKEGMRNEE